MLAQVARNPLAFDAPGLDQLRDGPLNRLAKRGVLRVNRRRVAGVANLKVLAKNEHIAKGELVTGAQQAVLCAELAKLLANALKARRVNALRAPLAGGLIGADLHANFDATAVHALADHPQNFGLKAGAGPREHQPGVEPPVVYAARLDADHPALGTGGEARVAGHAVNGHLLGSSHKSVAKRRRR